MSLHPCQTCGACCTKFTVKLYWREIEDPVLRVPAELTVENGPFHNAMLGTTANRGNRCIALGGQVGRQVSCSIYERRPSPCRDFTASFENGVKNERCDQVRIEIGLRPLTRGDWLQKSKS